MNRTLIAAAYPPELEGLTVHCAELMERGRVVARAVGVGLVEASAGIERAIDEVRPDRIVLTGTAGALPSSGLKIPEVVVVRRLLPARVSATRDDARLHAEARIRWRAVRGGDYPWWCAVYALRPAAARAMPLALRRRLRRALGGAAGA